MEDRNSDLLFVRRSSRSSSSAGSSLVSRAEWWNRFVDPFTELFRNIYIQWLRTRRISRAWPNMVQVVAIHTLMEGTRVQIGLT